MFRKRKSPTAVPLSAPPSQSFDVAIPTRRCAASALRRAGGVSPLTAAQCQPRGYRCTHKNLLSPPAPSPLLLPVPALLLRTLPTALAVASYTFRPNALQYMLAASPTDSGRVAQSPTSPHSALVHIQASAATSPLASVYAAICMSLALLRPCLSRRPSAQLRRSPRYFSCRRP